MPPNDSDVTGLRLSLLHIVENGAEGERLYVTSADIADGSSFSRREIGYRLRYIAQGNHDFAVEAEKWSKSTNGWRYQVVIEDEESLYETVREMRDQEEPSLT